MQVLTRGRVQVHTITRASAHTSTVIFVSVSPPTHQNEKRKSVFTSTHTTSKSQINLHSSQQDVGTYAQCCSVWRTTGLTVTSSNRCPPRKHLPTRFCFQRPLAPATLIQRLICRTSSLLRRPAWRAFVGLLVCWFVGFGELSVILARCSCSTLVR
jgi:hypothetical protein